MLAPEKFDIFLRKGRERMSPRSYGMTQLTFLRILVFTCMLWLQWWRSMLYRFKRIFVVSHPGTTTWYWPWLVGYGHPIGRAGSPVLLGHVWSHQISSWGQKHIRWYVCFLAGWFWWLCLLHLTAVPSIASPCPLGDFLWIQSHINLTNAYPMCVGCPKRNQIQLLTLGNSQSLWLKKP